MRSADVRFAVAGSGVHEATVCVSIKHLLPILRRLVDRRSWIIRLVLNQLINALEDYRKETCR